MKTNNGLPNPQASLIQYVKAAWVMESVQLRQRWCLAKRASHATLLGHCLVGMDEPLQLQHQALAKERWGKLYIETFYK